MLRRPNGTYKTATGTYATPHLYDLGSAKSVATQQMNLYGREFQVVPVTVIPDEDLDTFLTRLHKKG